MSLYDVALAAHVAGAAAVFLALGAWLYAIILIGRATTVEQLRTAVELIALSEPFVRIGGVMLAIGGLYMAIGTWGLGTGWVALLFGIVVVMTAKPALVAALAVLGLAALAGLAWPAAARRGAPAGVTA